MPDSKIRRGPPCKNFIFAYILYMVFIQQQPPVSMYMRLLKYILGKEGVF